MNRIFYLPLVCTAIFLLTGCAAGTVKETDPPETAAVSSLPETETEPLVYVSLGDSIARGYGLDNIREERFSTITAQIWEDAVPVEVYNYGVDGQTSGELIAMLEAGGAPELARANVVSVSIGANNVLGSAFDFLYDYYLYLYAEPAQFTDAAIAEEFRTFTAAADEGCVQLTEDLPLLLDTIRAVNPDCQILFLTLYNPYEAVNTVFRIDGLPVVLSSLSDTYVNKINNCIRTGTADAENLTLVDVYSAFAGRGKELLYAVTPEGLGSDEMNMAYMDPHPTAKGHLVIGQLTAGAYTPAE